MQGRVMTAPPWRVLAADEVEGDARHSPAGESAETLLGGTDELDVRMMRNARRFCLCEFVLAPKHEGVGDDVDAGGGEVILSDGDGDEFVQVCANDTRPWLADLILSDAT
eukprot:11349611-Heterocapsa_arctica.AAC.3